MKKKKIKDLFFIIGGNPAPKDNDTFSEKGLPFVKMRDLGKAHFSNNLIKFENYISDEKATELNLKIIKKGSILLPRSGSVALNHRAILGVDAYMVSHICALEVINKNEVNNIYAYYFLRTLKMDRIAKKTTGLDAITFEDLGKIQIPLPPLEDQIRIATDLSRADRLIARRKESIGLLDEFMKITFLEMFGDPVRNEKGWEKKALNTIAVSRLGKMRDKKNITGKYLKPYLGNSNVKWFFFDLDNLLEMDFNEEEQIVFSLEYGDLLICEGGEIGRCAIWKNQKSDCYFQKALHRVRVNKELLKPEYLQYVFYWYAHNNGFKNVTSKATITHLTGEKLKETNIPLPPLPLQEKFASIAEKVETIKTKYTESLTELENLYGSLSQKAFRGELDLSRVPLEEVHSPEPQEIKREVPKVDLTEKITSETEFINFIKSLPVKNFSFKELWNELEKSYSEDMPEYEKTKDMIYNLLDNNKLSQSFDTNKKEMVLTLNR